MRAYSASSEEALRARNLLKDWAGEGFLSEAQYQRMEQETVCELRRTNIFLRLVLFLFTLIIVGAAAALIFVAFLPQSARLATGIFLLIFAAISYAAAEFAVSRARLYRYGIEEALAACSVGFLFVGMQAALFSGRLYSPKPGGTEFVVPAAGAIASLWAAGLLDLISFGAASDRRGILHSRSADRGCGTLPPSLYIPRRGVFNCRGAPLARHLSGDQPPAFVREPARAVVGWLRDYRRILKAVLLGHLGADLVPATLHTRARPAPERPVRHRSGRGRRHPDPGHQ